MFTVLGGAAGGAVYAATKNGEVSDLVNNVVTAGTEIILNEVFDPTYEVQWEQDELLLNCATDFAFGKYFKVNGVNAGRNSMEATYKGGLTRIKNGNARRMSRKVKVKGGMASLFGGAPTTCVSMCLDDVENWFSENE